MYYFPLLNGSCLKGLSTYYVWNFDCIACLRSHFRVPPPTTSVSSPLVQGYHLHPIQCSMAVSAHSFVHPVSDGSSHCLFLCFFLVSWFSGRDFEVMNVQGRKTKEVNK